MPLASCWLRGVVLALFFGVLTACTEELTEQDHLDRVKVHESKGELNAAVIELKNALQKNPENPESRFRLGTLSLQQGDVISAEKELELARKLGVEQVRWQIPLATALLTQQKFLEVTEALDPSQETSREQRVIAQSLLADAHIGLNDLVKARSIYTSLLTTEKHNARVLTGMAKVDAASGRVGAAETYLSQALTVDPDNIAARFLMGALKNQRRQFEVSAEHFSHALKKLPQDRLTGQVITARAGLAEALLGQSKATQAREQIDVLLAEIPNHPIPNYLKGYADYQSGDLVAANEALQKVLQAIPDHPPTLMLLGAVNYGRGNLEQAETYLTRAFAADEANVGVRKLLAATRLQLNQPDEALLALSNDQGLLTGDSQMLSLSGTAKIASGDVSGGLAALEQSVKDNPDNRILRLELAGGYLRAKKVDRALSVLKATPGVATDLRRESLLMQAYLRGKRYKQAEALADKLLEARPSSPEAHFLAGLIFSATDKLAQALDQFRQTTQLQPDHVLAWMNLGRLAFRDNSYATAQQHFERVLSIDQGKASAMVLLAYSLERQGNEVQAIEWLEKARAADPNAVEARLSLIRYYLPKRRQEQALKAAQEAARVAPDNPLVINALGVVQMNTGDFRNARDSFEKVTRLAPQSADAFHNLGRVYIALQNIPSARRALNKSLEISPNHPLATSTLAVLETREGHYSKALSLARQQQKSQPQQANGFVLEGDVHMLNQQPDKAAEAYSKAFDQVPSRVVVLKLYGAQRKIGDPEAIDTIKNWLSEHPEDVPVKMAMAMTHQEEGNNQQAEGLYQTIIEAEPDAVEALNNLAWLYYLKGDKKSIELAERAHKLAPGVGAVTDTLGWILLETGDVQQGLKYLRQANAELPGTPDIQYHLAVGLHRANQKQEAKALLEAALQTGRQFENKAKAQQLLQNLR